MSDIRLQNTRVGGQNTNLNNPLNRISHDISFQTLLNQQLHKSDQVQFSKHAQERVAQRGIQLTPDLLNNLDAAVIQARAKGARDIVIINQSNAFIVNVPNNVVVTTMAGDEMKNNIFTNIDSAVLI